MGKITAVAPLLDMMTQNDTNRLTCMALFI